MSEKLKPCPICGATNGKKLKSQGFGSSEGSASHPWQFRHIECHGCGLNLTDQETDEEAAEKWNSLHKREKWSTDPPTEPGWYWYYDPNDPDIDFPEMTVISGDSAFFMSENVADITRYFADALKGQWQKIVEPELPPKE